MNTREYQDLTVRCRQSLVETTPLTAPEANRPRLRGTTEVVNKLTATGTINACRIALF